MAWNLTPQSSACGYLCTRNNLHVSLIFSILLLLRVFHRNLYFFAEQDLAFSVTTTVRDQQESSTTTFISTDLEKSSFPYNSSSFPSNCPEVDTVALQSVLRHDNHSANLTDFLQGPGLQLFLQYNTTTISSANIISRAVCRFVETPTSKHFPHALQQLYRCWSWWRVHADSQAVLVGPAHHRGFRPVQRPDLFTGLLQALQQSDISLQILTYSNYSTTANDAVVESSFEQGDTFAMATPKDALELRKAISSPNNQTTLQDWETGCPTRNQPPRLAILNRDAAVSRRSLLNAQNLSIRLQRAYDTAEVKVVYFENKTFAEQIDFWSHRVDLVVSTHGAQLSGMALMPSCGSVLEIFPAGYYVPFYFGSLAEAAGLAYATLYVSNNSDWKYENAQAQQNVKRRFQTRRQNLCPQIDSVVQAVGNLIKNWEACCQSQAYSK